MSTRATSGLSMIVTGHADGVGWVGGRDKTVTFRIQEKELLSSSKTTTDDDPQQQQHDVRQDLATIQLQGQYVLSSMNPWLVWRLEVVENVHNSNYRVTRVLSCENSRRRTDRNPLGTPLKKKDVVDYFMFAKKFDNRQAIMERLRALPSHEDVTDETLERYMPVQIKSDVICKQIYELVRVLSQPEPFYALLCFFSSSIVYGLSLPQQLYLLVLLRYCPFIFSFRSSLQRLLELGELSPFRGEIQALKRFQITPDYSSYRVDMSEKGQQGCRERLVYRSDDDKDAALATCFHPSLFVLPFEVVRSLWDFSTGTPASEPYGEHLDRLIETYSEVTRPYAEALVTAETVDRHHAFRVRPENADVYHEALQLYLHFEQKRFAWGSPVVEMSSYPRFAEFLNQRQLGERTATEEALERSRRELELEEEQRRQEFRQQKERRVEAVMARLNPHDPTAVRPLGSGSSSSGNTSTHAAIRYSVQDGDGDDEQANARNQIDEARERIEALHQRAVDFLLQNYVLAEAATQQAAAKRHFCLYEDYQLDQLLVKTLRRFANLAQGGNVSVYRQGWNTPVYPQRLINWLMKRFKPEIETNRLRLRTSSRSWADYLELYGRAMRFQPIPHKKVYSDFVEEKLLMLALLQQQQQTTEYSLDSQNNIEKRVYSIVFERAHKLSAADLVSELWRMIANLSAQCQVPLDQIRLDLHFIGRPSHAPFGNESPTDLPVFNRSGTHNIWQDLCDLYSDRLQDLQWLSLPESQENALWKRSPAIEKLWSAFNNRILSALSIREFPDLDALAASVQDVRRKNRRRLENRNDPKTKIFCSSRQEQMALGKKLDLSKNRDYSAYKLYQNDEVSVLETGHYGTIKRILQLKADGSLFDVGKQGVELGLGTYYFVICQCTLTDRCDCKADYSSATHTISPCRVELIQRYDGPPVDFVLFYVSDFTTVEEVRAAFGYALEDIHFFWIKRALATQRSKEVFVFEDVLARNTKPRRSTVSEQMLVGSTISSELPIDDEDKNSESRKRKREETDETEQQQEQE
jgi:hypothetical protein